MQNFLILLLCFYAFWDEFKKKKVLEAWRKTLKGGVVTPLVSNTPLYSSPFCLLQASPAAKKLTRFASVASTGIEPATFAFLARCSPSELQGLAEVSRLSDVCGVWHTLRRMLNACWLSEKPRYTAKGIEPLIQITGLYPNHWDAAKTDGWVRTITFP